MKAKATSLFFIALIVLLLVFYPVQTVIGSIILGLVGNIFAHVYGKKPP